MTKFFDRLADRIDAVDSVVSVGLDADPARLPDHLSEYDLPQWAFNRRIIDATHEHAAAFKPNAAFYEGPDGWAALEETIAYAHGKGVPVLLDADPARLPDHLSEYDLPQWAFNRRIIDATHEHAAAFKPNAAFYEGPDGWAALEETIAYAHGKGVPVLLDAKRADIGNTSRQYAKLLERVDAITVNPYMGRDSLQPFLSQEDAGVFVLARTSNPGGADLQSLELDSGEAVYERVAALAALWNEHGNVGLVVGATTPDELEVLREQVPDLPFLVPGVGAQGGDAEAAVEYGLANGVGLVNSTRGIIFAGENAGEEFDAAAGEAAKRLKRQLNQYR